MANPIRGAQLWEEIAVVLDDIIITTQQEIDINNKDIWNPYFHKWTNEDWEDMLSIIDHAIKVNPDIVLFNIQFCQYFLKYFLYALRINDNKKRYGTAN